MKITPLKRGIKQMKRSGFRPRTPEEVSAAIEKKKNKFYSSLPKTIEFGNRIENFATNKFLNKKRKSLRKASTNVFAVLERALWRWFSLYIKIRDKWTCITCGKVAKNWTMHAGHFIESAAGGLLLRFDESNVHAQCEDCNCYKNDKKIREVYTAKMKNLYGEDIVGKLKLLKYRTVSVFDYPFKEKIEYYKNKGEELLKINI